MTNPGSESPAAPAGATLAWAGYLASSWTWCIGMFLPVLLMRDYGWLAWVVFAAPNVIGAGAMGWTIRSADQARAMVESHRPAMVLFSAVTRAFQWYFAFGLLAQAMRAGTLPAVAGALAIGLVVAGMGLRRRAGLPWLGLVFWVLSAGLLTAAWRTGDLGTLAAAAAHGTRGGGPAPLAGLAAVCLFGFALCPYLDLTFHRTRIMAASPRGAFGIGFGVLFLAMIAGTAAYSGTAWRVEGLAGVLIAIHIAAQLAFTAEAHSAEVAAAAARPADEDDERPWIDRLSAAVPLVSMAVGLAALVAVNRAAPMLGGREAAFEWGYRVFMGFYGLVFPLYVLIAMVPAWREPRPPTPAMLRAWIVGSLVAFPASYLAFIMGRMGWVWAVMGVVAVATAIAWRAGPEKPITLRPRDSDAGPDRGGQD